jgi:heme A synthase
MKQLNPITPAFRRLTLITALFIYLLMIVGNVVRVTDSGLGCPDWPLCYGQVLPPPNVTALIEFSHRVVAALTGLLILAMTFEAWRKHSRRTAIAMPTALIISLLIVQVPLGGVVVASELLPVMVSLHLGLAMLILASAIVTAVAAGVGDDPEALPTLSPSTRRLLAGTAAALFVVLMSGALVVGFRASYACPTWPLCHGQILPLTDTGPQVWVQFTHRALVGLASLLVAAAMVQMSRSGDRRLRPWAWVMGLLFAAQAAVGAVQVVTALHPIWRVMHLALGTATWGALMVLLAYALLGEGVRARAARPERGTAPLEPSLLK